LWLLLRVGATAGQHTKMPSRNPAIPWQHATKQHARITCFLAAFRCHCALASRWRHQGALFAC
jgi:hypothetical protein